MHSVTAREQRGCRGTLDVHWRVLPSRRMPSLSHALTESCLAGMPGKPCLVCEHSVSWSLSWCKTSSSLCLVCAPERASLRPPLSEWLASSRRRATRAVLSHPPVCSTLSSACTYSSWRLARLSGRRCLLWSRPGRVLHFAAALVALGSALPTLPVFTAALSLMNTLRNSVRKFSDVSSS